MKPVVLLIEDQALNRELMEQILEDDYRVHTREDGVSGLAATLELKPDLLLLDLSLPQMDGWEVARRIRQEEEVTDLPIVALTAHAMPGDEKKALQAGCNAYLTKPVDEELLFATMRGLLEGDR